MNLSELREKTLAFLIPIIIIVIVLGGLIALIGRAYFWNVSELRLQFAPGSEQMVRLEVQARIIYFDADLFGFYYPVHITLPRTYEQSCTDVCVFSRLPPGDAIVTVFSDKTPLRARVLILPDTVGELDFRPAFEIVPVEDGTVTDISLLSDEEKKMLTGTIEYTSRTQGITLLRHNRENILYDMLSQQSMLLPGNNRPLHVARGDKEGRYLLWSEEGVMLWDRYGQTPTTLVSEIPYGDYIFTWKTGETQINYRNTQQTIRGYWSPLFTGEKIYITDGQEVRQIR